MRKIKFIVIAVFAPAAILFAGAPAHAADPSQNLAARAALLADVDSGLILFEHNMDLRHPADALTKVMTLLLAVSACETGTANPNDIVVMTESAYYNINAMSTTQNILPGERMTLLDLMYSGYVGNANEACNMIAEHIAGSVVRFIEMMNELAEELGCKNTNFTNANGQYNDTQRTSAMDQFIIFREAMTYPLFVEISSTFRHELGETNMSEPRRLTNSNLLMSPNSKYYYRPCTSGMASATYEGGYSLVSMSEANGLSLICVVLGSDDFIYEDESVDLRNFTETQRLVEWGLSQFSWRTILSTVDLVDKAPVTNGAGADFVNLRPESSIELLLNNDILDEDFIKTVTIYSVESGEALSAPISAGDVLGEVTVTRDGMDYGTILLVASTSIELHRLEFIRMQVSDIMASSTTRNIIWTLVFVVLGYIALVIRHNVLRRKRIRKIEDAKRALMEERQNQNQNQTR